MVDPERKAEQRVPDDEPGLVNGDVGEFRPARDVADRVDALVAGAQLLVDGDAVRLVADAGGIESEILDVRPASRGDQEMRAFDRLLACRASR